jgi:hypothetical protein
MYQYDMTVGHIEIFDLHRTVDDILEEDCFEFHLRRSIPPFKERFLICIRCPLLCAIVDGDENYHDWELARSAAEVGITPEQLKARREGKVPRLAIVGKASKTPPNKYHLIMEKDEKTLCNKEAKIRSTCVDMETLAERDDICSNCRRKALG